jgi:hypothetical protein
MDLSRTNDTRGYKQFRRNRFYPRKTTDLRVFRCLALQGVADAQKPGSPLILNGSWAPPEVQRIR